MVKFCKSLKAKKSFNTYRNQWGNGVPISDRSVFRTLRNNLDEVFFENSYWKLSNILAKHSILAAWHGSECASESKNICGEEKWQQDATRCKTYTSLLLRQNIHIIAVVAKHTHHCCCGKTFTSLLLRQNKIPITDFFRESSS